MMSIYSGWGQNLGSYVVNYRYVIATYSYSLIFKDIVDSYVYAYTYTYSIYVTGYWKTDHNVTLGQLHFIGPANSHTHALSMHCCITGLG